MQHSNLKVILSVCPQQNYFFIFYFSALFGMLLKGMGESFLLSEDKPLTPDIDGVMALWILEGGPKTRISAENLAKIGPLDPSFSMFLPPPLVRSCSIFFKDHIGSKPSPWKSERLEPFWSLRNKPIPHGICSPFPHTNLAGCTLGQEFNPVFWS